MTTPITFADFLRDARLGANLTQEELASRSGTHVNTVQKYEAGKSRPTADTAERLAAALELTGGAREQLLSYAAPESQTQTINHVLAALGALHQQLAAVLPRLAELESRVADLESRDGQRRRRA